MINLQYVVVIKDSQIFGHTPSEISSQTRYYITKGSVVCYLVSVTLLGEGGKDKA